MLTIESGIPCPPTRAHSTYEIGVSMQKCQPGDSFLVPAEMASTVAVKAFVSRYAKRLKQKFCVRAVVGGNRIWRVD